MHNRGRGTPLIPPDTQLLPYGSNTAVQPSIRDLHNVVQSTQQQQQPQQQQQAQQRQQQPQQQQQ